MYIDHNIAIIKGVTLKMATVDKKIVDLYALHLIVKDEGGYELCTRDRKWAKIATRMNFSSKNRPISLFFSYFILPFTESCASMLRQYYDKILYPYDIYESGATTDHPEVQIKDFYGTTKPMSSIDVNENDKLVNDDDDDLKTVAPAENAEPQNTELRKLQVFGAGPKMPGFICNDNKMAKGKVCHNCNESNQSSTLLTCNKCGNSFHKLCLIPPFTDNPKGLCVHLF